MSHELRWVKKGFIAGPQRSGNWDMHYCMCPTPVLVDEKTLRVFVCTTTTDTVGSIAYFDLDPCNPQRILNYSPLPVLEPGPCGAFDDSGVCPASVLVDGDRVLLYYFGFQRAQQVPYMIFTGLSIASTKDWKFERFSNVPILDRTNESFALRSSPSVHKENGLYRAWYNASTKWERLTTGKLVPNYVIRYAESQDGIQWHDVNASLFELNPMSEVAHSRPWVIRMSGSYLLWYSVRSRINDGSITYREIAAAESKDGIHWQRQGANAGLFCSSSGFDALGISYPGVIQVGDRLLMFYNGDGHGVGGFGYAEASIEL